MTLLAVMMKMMMMMVLMLIISNNSNIQCTPYISAVNFKFENFPADVRCQDCCSLHGVYCLCRCRLKLQLRSRSVRVNR